MSHGRLLARIEFAPEPAHRRGTLAVRLLDASAVDAPARVVAQASLPDVPPLDIDVALDLSEPLDPRASYVLWAHWDRSGEGRLRPGDQLTTTSNPVAAQDTSRVYTLRLSRI